MHQRLSSIFKQLLKHELISGSALLFVGGTIGAFLAFLFNFFLIHNLRVADYGIYASLVSLITLFYIPSQSLSTIIVRFATDYISKKETGKAAQFYKTSFLFMTVVSVLILIVFLLCSSQIGMFFHITDKTLLILSGLSLALGYLSIVNNAYVMSFLRFGFQSLLQALPGLVKLAGIGFFFFIGFSVFNSMAAVLLAFALPFIISFIPVLPLLKVNAQKITINFGEIVSYAVPAALTTLTLSSFTSSDVLLVKHFFPSHEAGLYAGLSLIGRVIFYFTGQIPLVMFPLIIKHYNEGKKFQNLLYIALLIVGIPALAITLFYFIFPSFTVKFFLGKKEYMQIAGLLGFMGIFASIFSITNVFVNFFLSLKKTIIAYFVVSGAFLHNNTD